MIATRRSFLSLLSAALLALFVTAPLATEAAHSIDAYRLIQYDRGSTALGSRRTALNYQTVSESKSEQATVAAQSAKDWEQFIEENDDDEQFDIPKAATQDLLRKVQVVRIDSLSPSKLVDIMSRGATGVLIVLPKDLSAVAAAQLEKYRLVEKFLATRRWDAAIYFAFDDEYLSQMITNLQLTLDGSAPAQDRYHVQVATADATALSGVTVANFHGWQHAAVSSTTDSDTLPTIALVANYDSLAPLPGLAAGLDQNGSGTIAVLEVARIFSKLYADFRTQGNYNLLFILTGLDRLNYVSTKNWLRNIDSRVLESLEFALCLERIAAAPAGDAKSPLYLHVSKLAKTPEIKSIYDNFASTATAMNIDLEIVHKKINISNPTIFWQHEQFSRKRIVAATLSTSRNPQPGWEQTSLFDEAAKNQVNLQVLEKNIHFIVEVLSKQIYGLNKLSQSQKENEKTVKSAPVQVINSTVGIHANKAFIRNMMESFRQSPRVTAYISDLKTNTFLNGLEAQFKQFVVDFKKSVFQFDQATNAVGGGAAGSNLKIYKDKEGGINGASKVGVVEMQLFQVKPFMFDVYVSVAISVYMLVIYIACQQPSNVGDVIAVLIGR